jgi:hypothetical protein
VEGRSAAGDRGGAWSGSAGVAWNGGSLMQGAGAEGAGAGHGKIKRMLSLVLESVPYDRIKDASFWFMIYRMMVYPAEDNGPKVFYERLLPYLNSKPLMANVDKTTPWRQPPHGNDTTHCQCIFETLHCAVRMVDGGNKITEHIHGLRELGVFPEVVFVVIFKDQCDATFLRIRQTGVDTVSCQFDAFVDR